MLPAYSISKAAAFSLTQSLRALLAERCVSVHAVMPGPIDTDMVRDLPIRKTPPDSVARGIFDGMENDEEEIFPDPMSEMNGRKLAHWRSQGARAPERRARSATAPRGIGKQRDRVQLPPARKLVGQLRRTAGWAHRNDFRAVGPTRRAGRRVPAIDGLE